MKHSIFLAPLCAVVGCASLSSYQDARPLDKGQFRLAISETPYSDNRKIHDTAGNVVSTGHDGITTGFGIRYGFWNGVDAGVFTEAPYFSSSAADAKIQLVGIDSTSRFQLSIGLKGTYSKPLLQYDTILSATQANVVDLALPIYLGWTPNRWIALNAIPDLTWRTSDNQNEFPGGPIAGANLNARIGTRLGLIGEFGLHRHLTRRYEIQNYGFAIFAKI